MAGLKLGPGDSGAKKSTKLYNPGYSLSPKGGAVWVGEEGGDTQENRDLFTQWMSARTGGRSLNTAFREDLPQQTMLTQTIPQFEGVTDLLGIKNVVTGQRDKVFAITGGERGVEIPQSFLPDIGKEISLTDALNYANELELPLVQHVKGDRYKIADLGFGTNEEYIDYLTEQGLLPEVDGRGWEEHRRNPDGTISISYREKDNQWFPAAAGMLAGAVIGPAIGAGLVPGGGFLAGAASGAAGSAVSQGVTTGSIDPAEVLKSGATGGITASVTDYIRDAINPMVFEGDPLYATSDVGKLVGPNGLLAPLGFDEYVSTEWLTDLVNPEFGDFITYNGQKIFANDSGDFVLPDGTKVDYGAAQLGQVPGVETFTTRAVDAPLLDAALSTINSPVSQKAIDLIVGDNPWYDERFYDFTTPRGDVDMAGIYETSPFGNGDTLWEAIEAAMKDDDDAPPPPTGSGTTGPSGGSQGPSGGSQTLEEEIEELPEDEQGLILGPGARQENEIADINGSTLPGDSTLPGNDVDDSWDSGLPDISNPTVPTTDPDDWTPDEAVPSDTEIPPDGGDGGGGGGSGSGDGAGLFASDSEWEDYMSGINVVFPVLDRLQISKSQYLDTLSARMRTK